jgi:putative transposase
VPTKPATATRMSRYRRIKIEGGLSFFTLALADRRSDLLVRHIEHLPRAYAGVEQRLPFKTVAIRILPDHIHALWQLPDGDADYASRWSLHKPAFSRGVAPAPTRSASKIAKREKGIWQRRYWEHAVRDDADLERHVNYIHYNPVKHELVTRSPIGRSAVFTAMLRGVYCPPTGPAIRKNCAEASANEPRGHGASRLCPPYAPLTRPKER